MQSDIDEETYERAIENYKSHVMRVSSSSKHIEVFSNEIKPDCISNERSNKNGANNGLIMLNNDNMKVNIAERREMFEKAEKIDVSEIGAILSMETPQMKNFQRSSDFKYNENEKKKNRQSIFNKDVKISGQKKRLLTIEKNFSSAETDVINNKVDVQLSASLKERITNFRSCFDSINNAKANIASNKEGNSISNNESCQYKKKLNYNDTSVKTNDNSLYQKIIESSDTDREDSGVHTTDFSCSVSQGDEQNVERFDELISIEEKAKRNGIYKRDKRSTSQQELKSQLLNENFLETAQQTTKPDLIQHSSITIENKKQNSVQNLDSNVSFQYRHNFVLLMLYLSSTLKVKKYRGTPRNPGIYTPVSPRESIKPRYYPGSYKNL